MADHADGASTDQTCFPSRSNSTTFFSAKSPTIIVFLPGVMRTCLNCQCGLVDAVGITISFSNLLVAVLNINTLPTRPFKTIITLSLPMGWQECVSVPG